MKKILEIMLIMVMAVSMTTIGCFAANDHGADARSSSMSVESGEEPIDDEAVTREAGGGEIIEGEEDVSEEISEDAPGEEELKDPEEAGDSVEKTAGENQGINEEPGAGELTVYMITGAAVLMIILIMVLSVRSARRKKAYRSKH